MPENTPFAWHEIHTTDPQTAKKFYIDCFGWETSEMPMGEDGVYTMFNVPGAKPFGGICELRGEAWNDIPAHWAVYVSVEDIHAKVQEVEASGGKVVIPPFEMPDVGFTALVHDPQGAPFYLFQGVES